MSLASIVLGPRPTWTPLLQWYYRVLTVLTFGAILLLGYVATVDLFDSSWPGFEVPWMVEGSFLVELLTGLAGAVAVPLVLAIPWGRYFTVAAIAAVAVATLFHVTIAIAVVALGYQVAERVLARATGTKAEWLVLGVAAAAVTASVVSVGVTWIG